MNDRTLHQLHACRPEFWPVDVSIPELSKDLRSRGNGDNFQSPMGVALVVVRRPLIQTITFTSFTETFHSPDRMVTFSIALLLFCFVISNFWTQVIIALTSFPLLTFTLWCIWMCSDSKETVPGRLNLLFNVAELLRVRPASLASDDGSSRHSPGSSRGDVGGV